MIIVYFIIGLITMFFYYKPQEKEIFSHRNSYDMWIEETWFWGCALCLTAWPVALIWLTLNLIYKKIKNT